jgi:hypothetical protein
VPERNALVKAFQDKPVKFFAVMAHSSVGDAAGYQSKNGLTMPIFADNLGLMQKRYGTEISLKNIWQYRVVGADGKIVGYDMSKEGVEKAVESTKAHWKYRGEKDDPKLLPALDQLEAAQYAAGGKLLTPLRKSTNKGVAEAANKVYDTLKTEGEEWKAEAEKGAEEEPVKAYDLYGKLSLVFANDALGKDAAEARKKLAANKAVAAELAARKAYDPIAGGIARLTPDQKKVLAQQLQTFLKKHKDTPTGEKADTLLKEIDK